MKYTVNEDVNGRIWVNYIDNDNHEKGEKEIEITKEMAENPLFLLGGQIKDNKFILPIPESDEKKYERTKKQAEKDIEKQISLLEEDLLNKAKKEWFYCLKHKKIKKTIRSLRWKLNRMLEIGVIPFEEASNLANSLISIHEIKQAVKLDNMLYELFRLKE